MLTSTKQQQHEGDGLTLETPAFHLLFGCFLPKLRPLLRLLIGVRWKLSRPFQVRVVPKWFPSIPLLNCIYRITLGQIVLAVPIALLFVLGYVWSFVDPDVDGSGTMAALCIMGAFVTANKSSSPISFFLGIPFDRMIPYHNLCSLLAIVLSIFHTHVAYVHGGAEEEGSIGGGDNNGDSRNRQLSLEDSAYASFGTNPDLIKYLFDGKHNLSGTGIVLCMVVLVSTSFFSVLRSWLFEAWLVTHIGATVGVVVFSVLHGSNTIFIVASWWAIDLAVRYVLMPRFLYPREATLELILPDVVEVRFAKPDAFQYLAGQFVQVSFPGISAFQFHPISISSAPHETEVTLHIRALGSWSNRVAKLAEKHEKVDVLLEGPYGNLSMDVMTNDDRYQMVLLVSGGIGVTPCLSVARSLLESHANDGHKLEKLEFVWAVPNVEMAEAILSPVTETMDASVVDKHVYVTRSSPQPPKDEEAESSHQLPYKVRHGRPDLNAIVKDMKEEAEKQKLNHVAVIACGPSSMLEGVRVACRQHACGSEGVTFDLHEEIFEF